MLASKADAYAWKMSDCDTTHLASIVCQDYKAGEAPVMIAWCSTESS